MYFHMIEQSVFTRVFLTSFKLSIIKATPDKFPVSRPDLRHICMWAGGPFPLFHNVNGSFSSHYLPGTAIKSMLFPFQVAKITQT